MVEIFCKLIKTGMKTIDDVPDKLKLAVQELLDKENV